MNGPARTTLWAFLFITGVLATAYLLLWHDGGDQIHGEDYLNVGLLDEIADKSPLLSFGPEDVEITHGWSFFSGIYPAVTFRCRFNSPRKGNGTVILCYRTQGSSEWLMADTRVRRDNTARLTLRDLKRATSYECFFVLVGNDCLLRSARVVFDTADPVK